MKAGVIRTLVRVHVGKRCKQMGCTYVPGKERSIHEIVRMVKWEGKMLSEDLQKTQEEKQYTAKQIARQEIIQFSQIGKTASLLSSTFTRTQIRRLLVGNRVKTCLRNTYLYNNGRVMMVSNFEGRLKRELLPNVSQVMRCCGEYREPLR
jgi:hypothetical protein